MNLGLRIGLALCAVSTHAQLVADDELVTLGEWNFLKAGEGGVVAVEDHLGVPSLLVERAEVALADVEFAEGVIEFDIAFDDRFGFGGPFWHASEDGLDNEYFYIRQHKSGEPDAVQYTPMRGGLTSWQIFADANAIAPFSFTHDGWNHFRMVVANDQADIYFNGSTRPVLHVPDLATDRGHGGVGFRATGTYGKFNIASLKIRPLEPGERIVGEAAQITPPPSGTITNWSVSEPFDESRVDGQLLLPQAIGRMGGGTILAAEPFGIVDLSRAASPGRGANTVLVASTIKADRARPVRLKFGYSDRLRLFLNGELVFDGVAGWRTRDHFFLGTIGFNDAVVLRLRKGENQLQAAVSETFGGWGFAGAIEDRKGLTIVPEY